MFRSFRFFFSYHFSFTQKTSVPEVCGLLIHSLVTSAWRDSSLTCQVYHMLPNRSIWEFLTKMQIYRLTWRNRPVNNRFSVALTKWAANEESKEMKTQWRIIYRRTQIWYFTSRVQLAIQLGRYPHMCDVELNTRREISTSPNNHVLIFSLE